MSDDLEERLVLGDQLMARGDPGGELMVVQCELERGAFERSRGIALRKREVALLREARARLRGTPLEEKRVRFRRGVIDAITIDIHAFLENEEAIWTLAPHLRHALFHGLKYMQAPDSQAEPSEDWAHVREPIALALKSGRLASLGLLDPTVDYEVVVAASYPAVDEWEDEVRSWSANDRVLQWLIETKLIATLRGLELWRATPRTLQLLATEPAAAHLEDIHLACEPLAGARLGALATTKLAPLRIAFSYPSENAVIDRSLTDSPFMRRVTDLTVPWLGDLSIARQLRRLAMDVSYERGALDPIATTPDLAGVEELVLGRGRFMGTVDLLPLHDPTRLDSLRVLRIHARATVEAVSEFLRSPLARRLEAVHHLGFEQGRELDAGDWDGLVLAYPER